MGINDMAARFVRWDAIRAECFMLLRQAGVVGEEDSRSIDELPAAIRRLVISKDPQWCKPVLDRAAHAIEEAQIGVTGVMLKNAIDEIVAAAYDDGADDADCQSLSTSLAIQTLAEMIVKLCKRVKKTKITQPTEDK